MHWDVEGTWRPLAFYQFDPVSLGDGRFLIEAPIVFMRGAKNVEVLMTPAVDLSGRIVISEAVERASSRGTRSLRDSHTVGYSQVLFQDHRHDEAVEGGLYDPPRQPPETGEVSVEDCDVLQM